MNDKKRGGEGRRQTFRLVRTIFGFGPVDVWKEVESEDVVTEYGLRGYIFFIKEDNKEKERVFKKNKKKKKGGKNEGENSSWKIH